MTLAKHNKDLFFEAIEPHVVFDPERAFVNLVHIRNLALAADTAIHIYGGYEVPSRDISVALLEFVANTNEAMGWLAARITVDDTGCWTLPLKEEYDSKGRARYPQVSIKRFDARSELSHRFILRRLFGSKLDRAHQWDHVCRNHSCCGITHGEITSPAVNNARQHIARRAVAGELPLF